MFLLFKLFFKILVIFVHIIRVIVRFECGLFMNDLRFQKGAVVGFESQRLGQLVMTRLNQFKQFGFVQFGKNEFQTVCRTSELFFYPFKAAVG